MINDIYNFSKVRNYLYVIENEESNSIIVCFRFSPTERFTRLDFGTIDKDCKIENFQPVDINITTKITGIKIRKFYITLLEIIKDFTSYNPENLLVIESESIVKHRLLRRMLNNDLNLVTSFFTLYMVKDNEQFYYNGTHENDAIIMIPCSTSNYSQKNKL